MKFWMIEMIGIIISDRGSKYFKWWEYSLMNGFYEILNMVYFNFNIFIFVNNGVFFFFIVILNKLCCLFFRFKRLLRCLGKKFENYGKN